MSEEKKVLLSVQHLEQFFKMGRRQLKAVNDVSFDIYKGEVFGLVGESGCGKTTTGRSIIRLYDITGGSVYFDGQRICAGINTYKETIKQAKAKANAQLVELKKQPATPERDEQIAQINADLNKVIEEQTALIKSARYDHKHCNKVFAEHQKNLVREKYEPMLANMPEGEEKKALQAEYKEALRLAGKDRIMNKMQMIFQDPIASLNPRMTVREIIAEGLVIRGIKDKAFIDEQVYKVLDLVGLVPEHASRYPHEFSGGQRQRIGIARALAVNPKCIICDEPVSALDVSIQAQIINMFEELQEKLGLTYLFIAHDLLVVKHISDRIAVMYLGHIVEMGPANEIYNHPSHPYSISLLSAVPIPDPDYAKNHKRIVLEGDVPSPLNMPSGCPFRTRCPRATEKCAQEMPPLKEIAPEHLCACWNL